MKNNFPLVSVVIPTYNSSKWIIETIESVINQSYKNLEIVIVDDGSSDDTEIVLANFIQNNNNVEIQYFKISNSGPACARNFGVSKCKGDFIAFLDSDDLWLKEKIHIQIEYFLTYPDVDLLTTNVEIIDKKGTHIGYSRKKFPRKTDNLYLYYFSGRITMNTPTIMVKKNVFLDIGGFNQNMIHREDHYFLMCVSRQYKIININKFLVKRRVHSESISFDYKSFTNDPHSLIKSYYQKRMSFYDVVRTTFQYIPKKLFNKEISKFHLILGMTLFNNGQIHLSKVEMKKALSHYKSITVIIRVLYINLPKAIRHLIKKFIGKVR